MRFLERPDTPAQVYAAVVGMLLVALGALSFIVAGVDFGTVGLVGAEPEFLLWSVNGWTAVFWIAIGALGLPAASNLDGARLYCLFGAVVFSAVALWGIVDGNDVAGLLVADTMNSVTHVALAVFALFAGLPSRDAQRPKIEAHSERRFDREITDHDVVGRR
jgi:hypothetical protein